jgi:ubiquinone/menaquinone biosynthesis C-methylase UbiE
MWFRSFNPKSYWSKVLVTGDKEFVSREDSLEYLKWRNSQYYNYDKLMPVNGHDGEVILDYGCGPGNDIVGFIEYSNLHSIVGIDISETAINLAYKRLSFHDQSKVTLITLNDELQPLPFHDKYFDYIHSSGVLHHVSDLPRVLQEMHRVLKDDGYINVMIYNRDSIFYHLHISYLMRKYSHEYDNKTDDEIFKQNTDGEHCPISIAYLPGDFIKICNTNKFNCTFVGAAITPLELSILHTRFEAIEDSRFQNEHKDFLNSITFDERGFPLYNGFVAGVDAVYKLTKHGVISS